MLKHIGSGSVGGTMNRSWAQAIVQKIGDVVSG